MVVMDQAERMFREKVPQTDEDYPPGSIQAELEALQVYENKGLHPSAETRKLERVYHSMKTSCQF